MPNLEAYKKLAKQLQSWHRVGNYSIGERVRRLPRYCALTDQEALALEFPLHEAQEIIALEAGHPDWPSLKAAVEHAVPEPKSTMTAVNLQQAVPVVLVLDVNASAAFFCDQLGFNVDFLHGHPAFYSSVSRDGATLHLRFVHEPPFREEVRAKEDFIACFIRVNGIKILYAEYLKRGIAFQKALSRESWGGLTFSVRDLDGNAIFFSE
ncbi:MAG TPA: glyoxalase superfamily protein [Steroidobacteraceae bacterium]|nr:glyoxalase superfamily protein [Steroidobacteraceae bacterium]